MDALTGDLAFLPLGGTGEIGMNLNLYRCDGQWLAIDCGIGFGGNELPEADVIMPDPAFIAERRDKLLGLVITHAHEDHVGAVAHLWRQLRCPVYATPFTAAVLRRKLTEAHLVNEVRLHVIPPGGSFELGPFRLQFLRVAHSTPEAQGLAIRTPYGTVVHTGDWKLDPHPLVGPPTDEAAFSALGDEGVLAMVCDSTNALVEGHSGSEGEVRRSLSALIKSIEGRVAVTCFASNVARVESVAIAARDAGRTVALVGRSLRNLETAARETGYLSTIPQFVSEDAANDVPDENLLILITGSQGEARSALARVAADTHPNIALGEGDTVIFSSRMIPGNEKAIGAVQDNLVRRGVRVMTDDDHMVHVSGHPAPAVQARPPALRRARAWRVAPSDRACSAGAGAGRHTADLGKRRHIEPVSRAATGDGQRAGGAPGAGRQPGGAAAGRGDGRTPAHAVQRRGRGQPGGGCDRTCHGPHAGDRARAVRTGGPGDRAAEPRFRLGHRRPAGTVAA